MLDDLHLGPLGPDRQLLRGGGPEGIPRRQQDPVPIGLQAVGQLADGGGLAHAVDPDHQDHRRLAGQVQAGLSHRQHFHQNLPQAGFYLLRLFDLPLLYPLPQGLHRLQGGLHPHIREDQGLLQFLKKVLIHGEQAGENIELLNFIKQSHGDASLFGVF